MNWNTEMYMNSTTGGAGIFLKSVTLGNSTYTDKWTTEMLGWVDGNKVYRYADAYNEDTDTVEECSSLEKECESPEAAIEYAKEIFHVTKIIE
jgi:hypothetical protein